jgi:hypothetical protein
MPDQEPAESKDACPVCRTLPLHELALGIEVPPMEYQLTSDADAADYYDMKQFDRCALYSLARNLHKIWSGAEEFPTQRKKGPGVEVRFATCGAPTVLTDPESPVGKN